MPRAFVFIPHRLASVLLIGLFILSTHQTRALGQPSPGEDRHEKPYALIFMTVWGPDSRPLYGVKIKVRLADQKKAKWEGLSDHRGEFALRVPAGKADYVAWADIKGYKLPNGKGLQSGD